MYISLQTGIYSGIHGKLLVAAIDFGTTYSGWAFSFKHEYIRDPTDISFSQWYVNSIVMTLIAELRYSRKVHNPKPHPSNNQFHIDWLTFVLLSPDKPRLCV